MKTIIVTEFLHHKDHLITHLEEILTLYPEATIMSLSYINMSLGAKVESHTIISNQVEPLKLKNSPWLMNALVKNMHIPEDTDQVISLSRGYVHRVKTPENCKHFAYVMDYPKKSSLMNKLIPAQKVSADKVIYASEFIAAQYGDKSPEILHPFFKLGTHELDGVGETQREIDCVIHLTENTKYSVEEIAKSLEGRKFLFHADNSTLDKYLGDGFLREEHSYQKGCHGTEQKLFENTRLFVDLSGEVFNPLCFQALSAGVGAYIPHGVYSTMIPAEYSMSYLRQPNISEALDCSWWEIFDPILARRHALRFNGRFFKRNFQKLLL